MTAPRQPSVAAGAGAARVKHLPVARGPAFPAGHMLVPSPALVAAAVARVPRGRVLPLGALRAQLAAAAGADYTCPVTTGLVLRAVARQAWATVAEASHDDPPLPVWRVVRDDGALLDGLPGGTAAPAQRLAAEGVAVTPGPRGEHVRPLDDVTWDGA